MRFQHRELGYTSFVFETNYENFDTLYEHVHFALHQLKELLELNIVQMGSNTSQTASLT